MAQQGLERELIAEQMLPYEAEPVSPENKLPPKKQKRIKRMLGNAAIALTVAVHGVATAAAVDVVSAQVYYQDDETVLHYVEGSEAAPEGSEVWFVFGGAGQIDSEVPARQFLEANHASGEKEAVVWIKYDNDGFDENDPNILAVFLEEHDIKRVGIVGISMGLPTGLSWFYEIAEAAKREGREIEWEIEDIVGYSSPFDAQDPWKADALRAAATLPIPYPGGMISKWIYNADLGVIFGKDSTDEQRRDALGSAWEKTWNKVPPAFFLSQMHFLYSVDINEWQNSEDLLSDDVKFIYLIGELADNTIDAEQAANKYFEVFAVGIGATWRLVKVIGAGHADTSLSAQTMAEIFGEETGPQNA